MHDHATSKPAKQSDPGKILSDWTAHLAQAGKPEHKRQPFLPEGGEQFAKQMDLLYAASGAAHGAFAALVEAFGAKAGFKALVPGLKRRETAEMKLTRGGAKHPPSTLTDIVRGTVLCPSFEALMGVARELQLAGAVLSMKDRFSVDLEQGGYDESKSLSGCIELKGAQDSGYRDTNLLIRVPVFIDGLPTFVVSELQLNLPAMARAKEVEHPVYEITRIKKPFNVWFADAKDPRFAGGHGKAFDQEAAQVLAKPDNYTPYAIAAANGYVEFRKRHDPHAAGDVRCACGKHASTTPPVLDGAGKPEEDREEAQIAMVAMSEIVDGAAKYDAALGQDVPGRHLAAQIELIGDVVRVRANAYASQTPERPGDTTSDASPAVHFEPWCSGSSPLTLLNNARKPADRRRIVTGVAASARTTLLREAEENRRLVDRWLASGDAGRQERAQRLGKSEQKAPDVDLELWAASRPREYTLADVDLFNGLCAKLPRRHAYAWKKDADTEARERAALVASLKAPLKGLAAPKDRFPVSRLSADAAGRVASFIAPPSSKPAVDRAPLLRPGKEKRSQPARDDFELRKGVGLEEPLEERVRSLFDEFALFYTSEMDALTAAMPKLYDIFLHVRAAPGGGSVGTDAGTERERELFSRLDVHAGWLRKERK